MCKVCTIINDECDITAGIHSINSSAVLYMGITALLNLVENVHAARYSNKKMNKK